MKKKNKILLWLSVIALSTTGLGLSVYFGMSLNNQKENNNNNQNPPDNNGSGNGGDNNGNNNGNPNQPTNVNLTFLDNNRVSQNFQDLTIDEIKQINSLSIESFYDNWNNKIFSFENKEIYLKSILSFKFDYSYNTNNSTINFTITFNANKNYQLNNTNSIKQTYSNVAIKNDNNTDNNQPQITNINFVFYNEVNVNYYFQQLTINEIKSINNLSISDFFDNWNNKMFSFNNKDEYLKSVKSFDFSYTLNANNSINFTITFNANDNYTLNNKTTQTKTFSNITIKNNSDNGNTNQYLITTKFLDEKTILENLKQFSDFELMNAITYGINNNYTLFNNKIFTVSNQERFIKEIQKVNFNIDKNQDNTYQITIELINNTGYSFDNLNSNTIIINNAILKTNEAFDSNYNEPTYPVDNPITNFYGKLQSFVEDVNTKMDSRGKIGLNKEEPIINYLIDQGEDKNKRVFENIFKQAFLTENSYSFYFYNFQEMYYQLNYFIKQNFNQDNIYKSVFYVEPLRGGKTQAKLGVSIVFRDVENINSWYYNPFNIDNTPISLIKNSELRIEFVLKNAADKPTFNNFINDFKYKDKTLSKVATFDYRVEKTELFLNQNSIYKKENYTTTLTLLNSLIDFKTYDTKKYLDIPNNANLDFNQIPKFNMVNLRGNREELLNYGGSMNMDMVKFNQWDIWKQSELTKLQKSIFGNQQTLDWEFQLQLKHIIHQNYNDYIDEYIVYKYSVNNKIRYEAQIILNNDFNSYPYLEFLNGSLLNKNISYQKNDIVKISLDTDNEYNKYPNITDFGVYSNFSLDNSTLQNKNYLYNRKFVLHNNNTFSQSYYWTDDSGVKQSGILHTYVAGTTLGTVNFNWSVYQNKTVKQTILNNEQPSGLFATLYLSSPFSFSYYINPSEYTID